jgi:hypothetical protein
MNEGGRYEAIYTTMNDKGEMNVAPIGVKCINDYDVAARIFEGSTTLENIKETNLFVVNVTSDPKIFAQSLYGELDESELVRDDDICYLKNADAYFIGLVKSIEEVPAEKDHVNEGVKSFVITAENIKIVINRQGAKALNRGLFAFLESLVDYSRVDIIDDEKRKEYKKRFEENERLIKKVGESDVKDAMAELKEKMIEKEMDL